MGVYVLAKGTHGEEERVVCPGETATFKAPSEKYWTSVEIEGFGTKDQSASGTIKWS